MRLLTRGSEDSYEVFLLGKSPRDHAIYVLSIPVHNPRGAQLCKLTKLQKKDDILAASFCDKRSELCIQPVGAAYVLLLALKIENEMVALKF